MRRITLPDGRTLALEDRGLAYGSPVLFLHAAPGSRLLDPDPWSTAGSRVWLLSYDRPGYGASSPLPEGAVPTLMGFADDAAAALDKLRTGPVGVVGWSAGGLVALALAARRPDLVRAVAMVGTPAHEDEVSRLDDEYQAMVDALRPDLASAAGVLQQALAPLGTSTKAVLDMVGAGPADDALRTDQVHGPALRNMAVEAIRQGVTGIASDIVATTVAPWGFEPRDVTAPVALWYGEDDELVSPVHGAWWADVLPSADLRIVPGAGHFLPLVAWKQILASVT
ncbi:MAG: alpha/beta fold hydrolase [Acidimicrobiales bacterium]